MTTLMPEPSAESSGGATAVQNHDEARRTHAPGSPDAFTRLRIWLGTPAGLAALFAAAFALRLLIAPHVGFYEDLFRFRVWAERLAEIGPRRFYSDPGLPVDYPPAYLYVLLAVGKLSRAFGASIPGYLVLKLPAILSDLSLAWVAGELAARISGRATATSARVVAVVAVLFNPAVIGLSTVWGQVDALPACLVLGSVLLLFTGRQRLLRDAGGALAIALALAMKPQSAVVLPAIALGLLWRFRNGRSVLTAAKQLAVMVTTAVVVLIVTGLPFGLGPLALLRFYRFAASVYPFTSVWAFNLWGFVGFWRPDIAINHTSVVWRAFGIPAVYAGALLFALGVALVLRRARRTPVDDRLRVLVFGAAAVSILGFAVLTRMHERYLFLALACLAPLAANRWLRRAYAVVSVLFLINIYFPFVGYNSPWSTQSTGVRTLRLEPLYGWLYGGFGADAWQKKAISLSAVGVFFAIVVRGWRAAGAPAAAATRWTTRIEPLTARVEMVVRNAQALSGKVTRPIRERLPAADRRGRSEMLDRAIRVGPPLLVGAVALFNLVVLRAELQPTQNLNDSAQHFQMVRWATHQIGEGRNPLDGWYRYFALGSAAFHQYHTLPHLLTGYLARLIGANAAFHWTLYLLLALWPLGVWWAVRIWGFSRWTAAVAAAVSPLIVSAPGYGFEHGSYTWQGYGVWSQLWAMWLLPFAWALTWRAVTKRRGYATAALVVALTIACHLILGYLALLSVGAWVITGRRGAVRRAARAFVVGASALVVGSWVIVPLLADRRWSTQSIYYKGSFFLDSYGARKVLGWLFTGRLFDQGRLPIVTLLVFAGICVCIARWRRDERARALLCVWTLSLLLFFGRPTLGPLLKLLPGMGDVQIHRFIAGVHMAGILLAGVGAAAVARAVLSACRKISEARVRAWATVAVVAAAVIYPVPAFAERRAYDARGAALISYQRSIDITEEPNVAQLIDRAKALGGGRIYAGLRSNWGEHYRVGAVSIYADLANHDADEIGFTFRILNSLSTDVEANFNENNPAHYVLYDVKYLILPDTRKPSIAATLLMRRGHHTLWETNARGYLDVVDTTAPITADRADLVNKIAGFLGSDLPLKQSYPTIAFGGLAAAPPTTTPGGVLNGPPGRVLSEHDRLTDGSMDGRVEARRTSVVLLRTTYHPRWRATVDGAVRPVELVAPSFVGVRVGPGVHTVRFVYVPFGGYPLLLALGALVLAGLYLLGRRQVLGLPPFGPPAASGVFARQNAGRR